MRIRRLDARQGYDLWSETYDATPNPVVSLDERVTPAVVQAERGERILDAGCGTGRYFSEFLKANSEVVGLDFSFGMLEIAHRNYRNIRLVLADLQRPWPFRDGIFDAVVCALVGEHLEQLPLVLGEMQRVLHREGRVVFSVYHPEMAAAGIEANFQKDRIEYRLGAIRHTSGDYTQAFQQAGFVDISVREFSGDEQLVESVPEARKYLGFPLLLLLQARNAT
ncbi:MAG: class I SAM-dependent methyltransferase [Bacteroidota bacterium]